MSAMTGRIMTKSFGRGSFLLIPVVICWKLLVLATRFVSGVPMLGRDHATTDATFLDDAQSRVGNPHPLARNRSTRWSTLAYWKRAIWRLVTTGVVAALVYGWFHFTTTTVWIVVVALSALVGIKEGQLLHKWCIRHHLAEYVHPLHEALAPQLRIPETVQPSEWLRIPRNFDDADADPRIRIYLPPTFKATNEDEEVQLGSRADASSYQKVVDEVVMSKLGLNRSEMTTRYHMVGAQPRVEYHRLPPVPTKVTVDMVRRALDKATGGTVVFGLARGGRVIKINLDTDYPHVMLSVPTGGGKSWTIRAVVTPMLPKDKNTRVVVLDPKQHSQNQFRDHPHVRIVRHIADMHDELVAIGKEIARRNEVIDSAPIDGEDADKKRPKDLGPRLMVVFEEANTLARRLASHWQGIKPDGYRGSSPALDAMADLTQMGREVMVNAVLVAQMGTAKATGGGESRENFGARFLGFGSSENAWRMVAGSDVKKPRSKSSRPGGMYWLEGNSPVEMQVVGWDSTSARDFAFEGFTKGERVSGSQCDREDFYLGKRPVTVTDPAVTDGLPTHDENMIERSYETMKMQPYESDNDVSYENPKPKLELIATTDSQNVSEGSATAETPAEEEPVANEPGEPLVSLSEAINEGHVFKTSRFDMADPLGALRRVANSKPGTPRYDPEFPQPVTTRGNAKVYRVADLQRWERNRPRGSQARRSEKGSA